MLLTVLGYTSLEILKDKKKKLMENRYDLFFDCYQSAHVLQIIIFSSLVFIIRYYPK